MNLWFFSFIRKLFRPRQVVQQEIPCPSDVLAGLLAVRILTDPEKVKCEEHIRGRASYRKVVWSDLAGISVHADIYGDDYSFCSRITYFNKKNRNYTPTKAGKDQLITAFKQALKLAEERRNARKQYEGDMAACDAIEEIMLKSAPDKGPVRLNSPSVLNSAGLYRT